MADREGLVTAFPVSIDVANRAHASIGTFAVDAISGVLSPIGFPSSGGKGPRNFALDVHDRGRTDRRHVAGNGGGIFIFPFDSDHVCGDEL